MVMSCCAFGCTQRHVKGGPVSFHSFPGNPEIRKQWEIAIRRKDFTPSIYSKVCSKHFTRECFETNKLGGRWLKPQAVPTIFDFPEHFLEKQSGRKSPTKRCISPVPCQVASVAQLVVEHPTVCPKQEASLFLDTQSRSESSRQHCISLVPCQVASAALLVVEYPAVCPEQGASLFLDTQSRSELAPRKRCISLAPSQVASAVQSVVEHTAHCPEQGESLFVDTQKPKKRRYAYVGDFTDEDFTSPEKAKMLLKIARKQLLKQGKALKVLQKKKSRLMNRMAGLKDVLKEVQKRQLISESAAKMLEVTLPGGASQLLKRVQKGIKKAKYPPELKTFALTLNFYSSKAYDYVRRVLITSLPHQSTLRGWYTSVDGSPGFTAEALKALQARVEEEAQKNQRVLCSLLVDEVAIRKHVEWAGQKSYGYVDYGVGLQGDALPVANEALVFMLKAINGNWKIPVGYFLIDGLSGSERANLVREFLARVHETGVVVHSLTFDGTFSNISMAENLGASMNPSNLIPFFKHPITESNVYIFLDARHLLKLVRNTLASKGMLVDGSGGAIQWSFITALEKFQLNEGLQQQKMKVKIPAQTLSQSVADALRFLEKDLNIMNFHGSEPTVTFIEIISNLFDALSSRNSSSKGFKSPMNNANEQMFLSFFIEAESYLKALTTDGNTSIYDTNQKTGFLGFLIGIQSVRELYVSLVKEVDAPLNFLQTNAFGQEHLETFFSTASKGGHSTPTAKQFEAAYKQLLVQHEVRGSETAGISYNKIPVCSEINSAVERIVPDTGPAAGEGFFHDHNYIENK